MDDDWGYPHDLGNLHVEDIEFMDMFYMFLWDKGSRIMVYLDIMEICWTILT